MATLDGLPNEILSLILANFCVHCCDPHQSPTAFSLIRNTLGQQREKGDPQPLPVCLPDYQALHSMCLVSTRFRGVAQPVLYHALVPWSSGLPISLDGGWSRRLLGFLRTVVRRPDLAAVVQRAVVGRKIPGRIKDIKARLVLEEAARTRGIHLADFVQSFPEDYRPKHLRLQEFYTYDHLLVMLLAYLPNLTRLTFSTTRGGTEPYEIHPLSLRAAGISTLPVRTLEIFDWQYFRVKDLDGLIDMTSSTLRTLNIASGGPLLISALAPHLLYGLRRLCILNCQTHGSDLASILSRCDGLESFIFEAGTFFFCCQPMMPACRLDITVLTKTRSTYHMVPASPGPR